MRMVTIDLRRRPTFGPSRQFDQGSDYDWMRVRIIGPICDALDIMWDFRAIGLIIQTSRLRSQQDFNAQLRIAVEMLR